AGALATAAWGSALADVAQRHEVLRTIFPAADGQPYQQVLDVSAAGLSLPVTQVAAADLTRAVEAAAAAPFDLSAQVPVRARLLRLDQRTHVLVVVIHHI